MGSPLEPAGGHAGLTSPRIAAYRVLADVEEGAFADRATEQRLADVDPAERALALELALGCIRLRARLDTELAHLVDRPLSRLDRPVLLWLRLGLYQLRETRIPEHAAVHETVESLVRTDGRRASGLVNGVLRTAVRLSDRRSALFPSLSEDPLGHLTSYGSHPEWLVRRWLERWPASLVARLVELDNRPARVTLRTLGADAEARAAGEPRLTRVPGFPGCWELDRGDPGALLRRLPAVAQDPAASAVVDYVGPLEDGVAADLCAAPGGKALALAARRDTAVYVAADRSLARLTQTAGGARDHGIDLLAVVADGRRPPLGPAHTVLLDVPCLGTGVLRRRADARWRVGPERLADLVRLQGELLDAAAALVEPAGLLVYATCSLEPEENETQVSAFLKRHPEFSRDSVPAREDSLPPLEGDLLGPKGELRVLPWSSGTDGAFAVRLRRVR